MLSQSNYFTKFLLFYIDEVILSQKFSNANKDFNASIVIAEKENQYGNRAEKFGV